MKEYSQVTIKEVKDFWEEHPLFVGENSFTIGTKEFFEEHRRVIIDDCCDGIDPIQRVIPKELSKNARILDLGCGIGFWTIELQLKGGFKNIYAADLTEAALELTKKRLQIYDLKADLSLQNAENTTFDNEFFDHVNCQGVIHHTPDTGACIREIARVLKKNCTAGISVYYFNLPLKLWPVLARFNHLFYKLGFGLKGRGREQIFLANNRDAVVRMYDGILNPAGKYFSKSKIFEMVKPYFSVENYFLSYFPSRVFPFGIPKLLHKFLAKNMGFMIYLNLRKI